MKTGKFTLIAALLAGAISINSNLVAQTSTFVKQIITLNSGQFEFAPPYTDFVTAQTYAPESGTVTQRGTIFTQSAQCVVISGKTAFVAAQDSIVKYNLQNWERLAAVRDSGLNQMILYNGKLVVSKQFPIVNHFVEVLDTTSLTAIAQVEGISGDCAGIVALDDTVYVAVNGGWMGTNGKLAVIDPTNWSLTSEVDFGTDAIGISSLYVHHGTIVSINESPYGVTDKGSLTVYHPQDRSYTNEIFTHALGLGAGINDDILYLVMDYGIGSINLTTMTIENPSIVPDPGSTSFISILSAAVDTLNGRIYANIGDYFTNGTCLVAGLNGDSITSYATGISTEVVVVDYQPVPLGIVDTKGTAPSFTIYPNPVVEDLTVDLDEYAENCTITIVDLAGNILEKRHVHTTKKFHIPTTTLSKGVYYLMVETNNISSVKPFIKE